jgi:hypothetical protein
VTMLPHMLATYVKFILRKKMSDDDKAWILVAIALSLFVAYVAAIVHFFG